jgi:hypothetical protein
MGYPENSKAESQNVKVNHPMSPSRDETAIFLRKT